MKPVILTFTRNYLPGHLAGGPVRTIANMVDRLGAEFEFRIVTSDRDVGDAAPYPDIQRDRWIALGKGWVRYVSPSHRGLRELARLVSGTAHDIVYLNSLFDQRFTRRVLLARRLGWVRRAPLILAPRGELSPGALAIKKSRKQLYGRLSGLCGLYRDITWQASSELEKEAIARAIERLLPEKSHGSHDLRGRVVVAPDVVLPETTPEVQWAAQAKRRNPARFSIVFVSRISPMKNLAYALRVVSRVRCSVQFSIYGPIEDAGYWRSCQAIIGSMPAHVEVSYCGRIESSDVVGAIAKHDLFLLPTQGENFGHVIYEALCAGTAVLVSDQTPWRDLEQMGVGWDLPLANVDQFVSRIEYMSTWGEREFQRVAENARRFAAKVSGDANTVAVNRRLFRDALASNSASPS